jgi:hypothetical protein
LPVFATVMQIRGHRTVGVAHCRKTRLTITPMSWVQTSGDMICCCHDGWDFDYQVQTAATAPERGYVSDNRKHPSPNEWFCQKPALFPVFRYIWSFAIDI